MSLNYGIGNYRSGLCKNTPRVTKSLTLVLPVGTVHFLQDGGLVGFGGLGGGGVTKKKYQP